MKHHFLFLCVAIMIGACQKEEGVGGKSSITGKVYKINYYDDVDYTIDTVPAAKEDVFIIYGDDTFYGDDVKTSPDGTYRFDYLQKGDYTLFAYSKDAMGNKVSVSKTLTISGKDKTFVVDPIYIEDGDAVGTAAVQGVLMVNFYDKKTQIFLGKKAVGDREVYITQNGSASYLQRERTNFDGTFVFTKLPKGLYTIWAMTYNTETEVPSVKSIPFEVTELNKKYLLTDSLVVTDVP